MHTQAVFSAVMPALPKRRRHSRSQRHAIQATQEEYRRVFQEITLVHARLQTAQTNFNHYTSPKAIDTCIFQMRAAQCRYEELLLKLQELQYRYQILMGPTP